MTSPAARALAFVRSLGVPGPVPVDAPVTVNFHPDRLVAGGRSVVECLVAQGRYRSQFETGISNGKVMPLPGQDREVWERRMFGGAYPPGMVAGRPVYGALNLAGHPDGASPRFGSCALWLAPAVSARATFSLGDSVTQPSVVGTADAFGAVWAALLEQVARTGSALGVAAGSPREWVAALGAPRPGPGRVLDDYVEAQVHGGLAPAVDVTAVVADPSLRGTRCGELLAALAPELRWHQGFVLGPDEFPAELRGPVAPRLAVAVARRFGVDRIDAAVLGRAARCPSDWAAFGPPVEVLQQIKYLWHVLVLLGRPA